MRVDVNAAGLIAVRDALVLGDVQEAYHQLCQLADPGLCNLDHWRSWEAVALSASAPSEQTPAPESSAPIARPSSDGGSDTLDVEKLRAALLWIDTFDPETTAAAEAKFGFKLVS